MSEVEAIKGYLKEESVESKNRKATEDLHYLCQKFGYSLLHNVQYQQLSYNAEKLADLLVVAHDLAQKQAVFPAELIRFNDEEGKLKMFVALVCYEGGKAKNAYLFDGAEFQKPGLFSIIKHDKKKGIASVNLGNQAKLDKYSFGNAIKAFGKGG